MPQPRKLDRPIDLHIVMPETLYGQITVHLFSSAHGRIPHGKLSGFIEDAVRLKLSIMKGEIVIQGVSNA